VLVLGEDYPALVAIRNYYVRALRYYARGYSKEFILGTSDVDKAKGLVENDFRPDAVILSQAISERRRVEFLDFLGAMRVRASVITLG